MFKRLCYALDLAAPTLTLEPHVDDSMAPMGDVQICEAVYILESRR